MPRQKNADNAHLPKYVRLRDGVYRFEPKGELKELIGGMSSKRLGVNYGEMQRNYLSLMAHKAGDQKITMPLLIDRYLAEVSANKKSEKSLRVDIQRAKLIKEAFVEFTPAQMKATNIYQYLDFRKQTVKGSTANRELSFISGVLRYAVYWGYIESTPCLRMMYEKEVPRDRDIQDNEFDAFYQLAMQDNCVIAAYQQFKYLSGRRGGEILHIQLSQIKRDGVHLKITKQGASKNNNRILLWNDDFLQSTMDLFNSYALRRENKIAARNVARAKTSPARRNDLLKKDEKRLAKNLTHLSDDAIKFSLNTVEEFFEYCEANPTTYLIRTEKGKAYTDDGFKCNFGKLMAKAVETGVLQQPFRSHDIRAKTAGDMDDIYESAELLGHKDVSTTRDNYMRRPIKIKPIMYKKPMLD